MSLMQRVRERMYQARLKQAADARNAIISERARTLASTDMTAQQAWDYAQGTSKAAAEAARKYEEEAQKLKARAAGRGIKLGD